LVQILQIVSQILGIVGLKIDRKYIDRLDDLTRKYEIEDNRDFKDRNNAAIDWLEAEIFRTLKAISDDQKAK
jgi:hypothetical protein